MISVYSLGLIIFEGLAFSGSAYILFKTYKKTKYLAHLLQGISFCFLLLNGMMRYITSFFSEEMVFYETTGGLSFSVVGIFWSLMNTFLIIGIYLLFFSFFYIKMNSFHPLLNIMSIIIGANIFAYAHPAYTALNYDSTIGVWKSSYDTLAVILIVPLFLVFIISILVPLITKIHKSSYREQRQQMGLQVLGLGVVLLYGISAGLTGFSEIFSLIRPFLLPLGWLIWALTLLQDPFNIMVSNAKVSQIYIATEDGLPIYFQDIEGTQNISTQLASSVISGVKSALEELVQREDRLSVLNYEKQVLGIVSVDFLRAYIFGERFDKILEIVLRFSLEKILKNPKVKFQLSQQVLALDEETMREITQEVDNALKSVLIL